MLRAAYFCFLASLLFGAGVLLDFVAEVAVILLVCSWSAFGALFTAGLVRRP